MNTCPVIQDTNRYYAQQDTAQDLADYRESLISRYRPLILAGDSLVINRITYSQDDVLSDLAHHESLDAPLAKLAQCGSNTSEILKVAMEIQGVYIERLDNVLEQIADSKLEEDHDV
ncbi:MAG: hypothetical protein RPT25_07040 [Cycloclasticus sp.]|jgi:hypothetical protein